MGLLKLRKLFLQFINSLKVLCRPRLLIGIQLSDSLLVALDDLLVLGELLLHLLLPLPLPSLLLCLPVKLLLKVPVFRLQLMVVDNELLDLLLVR